MMRQNVYSVFAGLAGFYGVAMGAYAAHGVADAAAAAALSLSSFYALAHAAVLLGWRGEGRIAAVARGLFAGGLLLFCGAIALKHAAGFAAAGALAPAGGVMLMAAWLAVAAASLRARG